MVKALQSSSISTCQYRDFISTEVNHSAPFRQSNVSFNVEKTIGILIVWALSLLRSIQNLKFSIFLLYQHHSPSPGTTRRSNSTHIQHFLNMHLHFFIHTRWDSSIVFFKWCRISRFDAMLNN